MFRINYIDQKNTIYLVKINTPINLMTSSLIITKITSQSSIKLSSPYLSLLATLYIVYFIKNLMISILINV